MRQIPVTDARDDFASVINEVAYGRQRVLVTRRGRSLVAVVPVEDLELLEALLEALEDQLDLDAARAALRDPDNRDAIPWDDVKSVLGG